MADANVDFGLDITDPATWVPFVWEFGTKAVGTGTPEEQIVASVVIAALAVASSFLTLGATLLIAIPAILFGTIGFVRLVWSWL